MDFFSPLNGKKILVTGASGGLGAYFAQILADAGADLALAARRLEKLEKLSVEIRTKGRRAVAVEMDVGDEDSIVKGVAAAWKRLGGLDVLVNNAGIVDSSVVLAQSRQDWQTVLNVNLTGVFLVAREVGKKMVTKGTGGSIINIASILGMEAARGLSAYAVSKAGVIQFTRVMALETARYGVRVNALAPGYIKTDMNSDYLESAAGQAMVKAVPQQRFGEKQDLDGPLLLLAGEQSKFITGTVLTVDGGHSLAVAGI